MPRVTPVEIDGVWCRPGVVLVDVASRNGRVVHLAVKPSAARRLAMELFTAARTAEVQLVACPNERD
jgi:hypothetical protein